MSTRRPILLPLLSPETRPTRPLPPTPLNQSHLVSLPTTLIYEILSKLSPLNLVSICLANKRLREICADKKFWKFKSIQYSGKPAFKPDRRIVVYRERMNFLKTEIEKQRNKRDSQISNFIYSVLLNKSDQNDSMLMIKEYISRKATLNYDDFSQKVLGYIRTQHVNFEHWIDLNSVVFEKYPLSEFNDNPVLALVKGIYDIKFSYRHYIYMLRDEKAEIKHVLENLSTRHYMMRQ